MKKLILGLFLLIGISASAQNARITALNDSLIRHKAPDPVRLATMFDILNISNSTVTASGTNTYTATLNPSFTSTANPASFFYSTISSVRVTFTNANTGASTINFNTYGAKPLLKLGGTALAAADIPAGSTQLLSYNGTSFIIVGSISSGGSGSITLNGDVTGTGTSTITTTVVKINGNTIPANAAGSLTNDGTGVLTWTPGGTGTVTSVSGVNAQGATVSIGNPTTTPAITVGTYISGMLKGDGVNFLAANAGSDFTTPTGTENLSNKTIISPNLNTSSIAGYVWTATNTTGAGSWQINPAAGGVTSFNTRTGAVTLTVPDLTGLGLTTLSGYNIADAWKNNGTTTLSGNTIINGGTHSLKIGDVGGDITQLTMTAAGTASLYGSGGSVGVAATTIGLQFNALGGSNAKGTIWQVNASGYATELGIGSTGQILTVASGLASWQNASAGFTNPMTTAGDIIIGDTGGAAIRLGIGTNTQVLTSNGTTLSWQNPTGGVSSVSGTANRISSTGGLTPVIDIAGTYVGQTSITTLGTISTGTWNGSVIDGARGGSGVANTGTTFTRGGNLTTVGAFGSTFTMTATTAVTFPTTGTLATLSGAETFANKTLTAPQINAPLLNTTSTLGYVWTATNTAGAGSWQASAGGGTALPTQTKNGLSFLSTDGSYGTPTPVWRQPLGMAKIYPGQDIKFFGTSFTTGNGVVATTNIFAAIVADQLGCTYTQYGVSGSQWFTAVQSAFSNIGFLNSNPSIVENGFNELRAAGNTTKTIETIKSGARAFLANQFLGTAVPSNSGSVTTTGTWTTQALASSKSVRGLSGLIRVAKTSGATLTYNFTGESIVIGTYSTDETFSHGGDFTYSIDGGTPFTYTGKNKATGVADGPGNKMTLIPNAVIVTGLGTNSHTVVVTTNSTDSVRIDYFGTLKNPASCAPVIISGVSKMNVAGYAITANVSDAIMEIGTAANYSVADEFNGWPVYKVDQNNLYNVLTDVYTDNIHPNVIGHQHFAQTYLRAIESGIANGGPNPILSDNSSGNRFFASNGSGGGAFAENRNPATGIFDNPSAGASQVQLITGSGFGRVDILTSQVNNTTPTITTSFDKFGFITNSAAGATAKVHLGQLNGATNLYWNFDPNTMLLDDTGKPGAGIAMGGISGDAALYFATSATNNATPTNTMILNKNGGLQLPSLLSGTGTRVMTTDASGNVGVSSAGSLTLTSAGNTTISATSTSSSSVANMSFVNSSGDSFQFIINGSSIATYKGTGASDAIIYHNGAAGNIEFLNDYTSGKVEFTSGGLALPQMSIAPTVNLAIASGSATIAPLRMTSGTVLTTTQAGVIEYDGTHFYGTITNGGTRYQLDQQGGGSLPITTTGDMIYSSSGSTAARLAIGSSGQVLQVVSGIPSWQSLTQPAFGTSQAGYVNGVADAFGVISSANTEISPGVAGTMFISTGTGSLPAFSSTQTGAFVFTHALNGLTITQNVLTGVTPNQALTVTGGAHTTAAGYTEDVIIDLNRTVQFLGSATPGAANIASQHGMVVTGPTYSFSSTGAQVIASTGTLVVTSAPKGSTNTTLTSSNGIIVQTSALTGTTTGNGILVNAPSGATNNFAINIVGNTTQAGNALFTGATRTIGTSDANIFQIETNAVTRMAWTSGGQVTETMTASTGGTVMHTITTPVHTSGLNTILSLVGGAYTGQTASGETVDVFFNLARTVTTSTGAGTNQRYFRITAPTAAYVGASTITTMATMAISGPPVAGTNATVTTSSAVLIEAGAVGAGTATANGITVNAPTGATTNNAASYSGRVVHNMTASSSLASGQYFLQAPAHTGGTPGIFVIGNLGNYTGIANAEDSDIGWALGKTVTFTGSATPGAASITLQRQINFTGVTTYAFGSTGAQVITDGVFLYASGGPTGGTNTTITNSHGFYVATVTLANTTNGFGGTFNAPSGATNNWAVQTIGNVKLAGNLVLPNVGNGISVKEGTNAAMGVATLSGGTITVSNSRVTANTRIFITPQETGTLTGFVRVSARSAGTSFTITSSIGTDNAVLAWQLIEPAP